MYKFLIFISYAFFAFNTSAGHEVQNGGSIVLIEGRKYSLADLHFVPHKFSSYKFDRTIYVELLLIRETLKYFLGSDLVNSKGNAYFASEVFHADVEYRFTHTFPKGCSFVDPNQLENVLPINVHNIACTQGSITYINPELFQVLGDDPKLQAFVIIHERLHSFAREQNYDVKMEFVSALFHLNERFTLFRIYNDLVKTKGRNTSRHLRCQYEIPPEILKLLNVFTIRARQLSGLREDTLRDLVFTKHGGIIETRHPIARESALMNVDSADFCLGDYINLH